MLHRHVTIDRRAIDWGAALTAFSGIGALLFLVGVLVDWGGPAHRTVLADLAFIVAQAIPIVLALRAAGSFPRSHPGRIAWRLIALAELGTVVGDLYNTYNDNVLHLEAFPTPADAGYLAFYPLMLAALLQFVRAMPRLQDRTRLWLDVGSIVVGGAVVFWYFVLGPLAGTQQSGLLASIVALAYPLGDLAIIFGIGLVSARRASVGRLPALLLLVPAQLLYVAGDLFYGIQNLQNIYVYGNWVGETWVLAAFLMSLGGQIQSRSRAASDAVGPATSEEARPFVNPLPYVGLALGYGLLLFVVRDQWRDLRFVIYVGSVVLTALVATRQFLVLRENERLYRSLNQAHRDLVAGAEVLRHSRAQLRTIFDNLDDLVFAIDLSRQTAPEVSPACEKIYGCAPAVFAGDPLYWKKAVLPDDRPAVEASEVKLALGVPVVDEYRIVRADGAIRWVQAKLKPTLSETGRLIRLDGFISDITSRKAAEEILLETNQQLAAALAELKAAQEQVVQQERLRALGQMATGIAHDFDNALAKIIGYLELMLTVRPETLKQPERVREYLELMNVAADDAATVVRRLREFYRLRPSAESFAPIDVNEVVEQTILLTQPRWRDQSLAEGVNVTLTRDLRPVPSIEASAAELREALTNLIFNAVQALDHDGTIAVRTRTDGEQVLVEVDDTGAGMTEDVRKHCLEPFYTTRGPKGSGMGLAMVYGMVQRHQGQIDIDTAPGRGTRITLRLPRPSEAASGLPRSEPAVPKPETLRVLVVDDEPPLREIIGAYLNAGGHDVVTATDGQEGYETFKAGRFDLVLTDRAMPGMNGDRLAAAIKEESPATPVIMLTGFGDLLQAVGGKPAGVDLVIGKPVSFEALKQSIKSIGLPAGRW